MWNDRLHWPRCRVLARSGWVSVPALLSLTLVSPLITTPHVVAQNVPAVSCETAKQCFEDALAALKTESPNQLSAQLTRLHMLRERYPDSLWAKRAGVRIGLILTDREPEAAIEFFETALQDFPLLADSIRFWMGEARLEAGDARQAAMMFEAVLAVKPKSVLGSEATLRAGQAWYQAGDCQRASRFLNQAISMDPESDSAPGALLHQADCALKNKQAADARTILRQIWWQYPKAPEAKTAMDLLNKTAAGAVPEPTADDRYRRAGSLFKLAFFKEVVSELNTFLAGSPKHPQRDHAKYKLGMALVRLKRYPQAETMFHQLVTAASPQAGKAIVWLGKVYLRQDKGPQLFALLESVAPSSLSRNQKARILWFSGIWLEDQEKYADAIATYRRAVQTASKNRQRLDALWRIGWIHYKTGAFNEAVDTFQEMRKLSDDYTYIIRAQYWMARALDQAGQKERGRNLYLQLNQDFPLTYYGQLARSRALASGACSLSVTPGSAGRTVSPPPDQSGLHRHEHYRRAVELHTLGLARESARELIWLADHYARDHRALLELSVMLKNVGAYDAGLRLAKRHFQSRLVRGDMTAASPLWSVAFPTGYLTNIQAYAVDGLDPYLVAAVIREESLYDSEAVSPVGALGLMQLMPTTAGVVARQLGLPSVEREQLLDEDINIRLGVSYLTQLLQRFQGNLVHTVAAYNAGPEAVMRWISRDGLREPDEFVERIGYRETRGYVKRVLGSYRVYHHLDVGSCAARSLDTPC